MEDEWSSGCRGAQVTEIPVDSLAFMLVIVLFMLIVPDFARLVFAGHLSRKFGSQSSLLAENGAYLGAARRFLLHVHVLVTVRNGGRACRART